jgi:hydroxymethylpyrimidine/phosphomethylpyrimidine kinase
LEERALPLLERYLAPRATVLTPNHPEAARLLGRQRLETGEEEAFGLALLERGWAAVLLKGGHGEGPQVVDWLVTRDGNRPFTRRRRPLGAVHGTGCALAAALAARLGRGESLAEAAAGAIHYVDDLLALVEQSGAWLLPHLAVRPYG